MSEKVKVVQVAAPGKVEIVERDMPKVEGGDMLVKIEMGGVCGTDVHLAYDETPFPRAEQRYPFPLGHEPVGVIAEMGDEALRTDINGAQIDVGDRIVWIPFGCGECYSCRILLQPVLCTGPRIRRRATPHIGGAFAEYAYVSERATVYKVPAGVPVESAALTEPFAGSIRAVERAFQPGTPDRGLGLGPGKTVVVQGSGCIGVLVTAVAKLCGAYKVIVIGAPENRLEMCRAFGADLTINFEETDEESRAETIKALTPHGSGPDVVIEVAGAPAAFEEALNLARRGGTVIEFGHFTHRGMAEIDPELLVYKDLQIFGARGFNPSDYNSALRILEAYGDRLPFHKIISHKFGLEGVQEALELSRSGGCVKAGIVP